MGVIEPDTILLKLLEADDIEQNPKKKGENVKRKNVENAQQFSERITTHKVTKYFKKNVLKRQDRLLRKSRKKKESVAGNNYKYNNKYSNNLNTRTNGRRYLDTSFG